jgi:hypothetical protein
LVSDLVSLHWISAVACAVYRSEKNFCPRRGKYLYVFGINDKNTLQHIYWGKHVWRDDDFAAAQSLPGSGQVEGCPFRDHQIDGNRLTITLKDIF